jgi:hypothetical protein
VKREKTPQALKKILQWEQHVAAHMGEVLVIK